MSRLILNGLTPIQTINNGALKSRHAMPQKDTTTDGTSGFEMSRAIYKNDFANIRAIPKMQQPDKKWIGGNRDASQITANRRTFSVGKGTLNSANTPLSFTTFKDVNVINDAKRRCRSGGCVVPKKISQNGIRQVNNYTAPTINKPVAPFVDQLTGQTVTNFIHPNNKSKTPV